MAAGEDSKPFIRPMRAELDPVTYGWASMKGLAAAGALIDAVATVHEDEGLSLLLPIDAATRHGLDFAYPSARITLGPRAAFESPELLAEVTRALVDAGISAHVVSGFHHDHVFVPRERASAAMEVLAALTPPAES